MSRGFKALLWALVVLGIVGFAVGLAGDLHHWWDEFGYTSNVLAGVTGACFGIPFAVLVLQKVFREWDEHRNHRDTLRLVRSGLDEMAEAAGELRNKNDLQRVREILALARECQNSLSWLSGNFSPERTGPEVCKLTYSTHDKLQELGDALQKIPLTNNGGADAAWSRINNRWRFLRDDFLIRATAGGFTAVSDTLLSHLDSYARPSTPPFSDLICFAEHFPINLTQMYSEVAQADPGHYPSHNVVLSSLNMLMEQAGNELLAYLDFVEYLDMARAQLPPK